MEIPTPTTLRNLQMALPKLPAPAKVGLATYNRDAEHKREGTSTTYGTHTLSGCRQGPTRPTPSDLITFGPYPSSLIDFPHRDKGPLGGSMIITLGSR